MNNQSSSDGCNPINQALLSTDDALKFLLKSAKVTTKTHTQHLDESLYQVLSEDICSSINVPGFDNSAMDGYALHLSKDQINLPGNLTFKVVDRITAGSIGQPLASGCAARIFTGAPIPKGANSVIMQEECELSADGSHINTWRPLLLAENIRPMGNDIQKNAVILSAGTQLKPEDIALSASVGIDQLSVFGKIRVGVFFTGNELIEPGNPLKKGQIFNSNRYALVALLKQLNCQIVNLGNIKDSLEATIDALNTLKSSCDLIITTGGVSVGEEDHVKPAIEQLGKLSLWRIKMKPGKPLAFGHIGKTAFIGLPGNPVSAMVTFFLFVRPFIKKMQGVCDYQNKTSQVSCNFDWHKPRPRREFVRVKLDHSCAPASANLYEKQGSDVLSSIVWADGLVEIPENTTFKKGHILNFYALTELSQ